MDIENVFVFSIGVLCIEDQLVIFYLKRNFSSI